MYVIYNASCIPHSVVTDCGITRLYYCSYWYAYCNTWKIKTWKKSTMTENDVTLHMNCGTLGIEHSSKYMTDKHVTNKPKGTVSNGPE